MGTNDKHLTPLMPDEKVVYSAPIHWKFSNNSSKPKIIKNAQGCNLGCLLSIILGPLLFSALYGVLFDFTIIDFFLLIFTTLPFLFIWWVNKRIEKSKVKYNNDFLNITTHGIRWMLEGEYNSIAWQDVQGLSVEQEDFDGNIGWVDILVVKKNYGSDVNVHLGYYLYSLKDVIEAINKVFKNSEKMMDYEKIKEQRKFKFSDLIFLIIAIILCLLFVYIYHYFEQ